MLLNFQFIEIIIFFGELPIILFVFLLLATRLDYSDTHLEARQMKCNKNNGEFRTSQQKRLCGLRRIAELQCTRTPPMVYYCC